MKHFHSENLILFKKAFQFSLHCSRFDHGRRMFIISLLCYRIFISGRRLRRLTVSMTTYKTCNF